MRNTQLIRWTRIISRLLDGRPKRLEDFRDIQGDLHKKTLLRDLEGLCSVPELQVVAYEYDHQTWYRMDARLTPTKKDQRPKPCNKCLKMRNPDEYFNHRYSPDGKRSICRYCYSDYNKEWRKNNRERNNAAIRRNRQGKRAQFNKQRRERWAKIRDAENAKRRQKRAENSGIPPEPLVQGGDATVPHRQVQRKRRVQNEGPLRDGDRKDTHEDAGELVLQDSLE